MLLVKTLPRPYDCWIWPKQKYQGYGICKDGIYRGKKAHRVSYEFFVGPIPKGLEIDHLCRNPSCVNPDHLEPVSHAENVARENRARRKSRETPCQYGHLEWRDYKGWRYCGGCKRVQGRKSYYARKQKTP